MLSRGFRATRCSRVPRSGSARLRFACCWARCACATVPVVWNRRSVTASWYWNARVTVLPKKRQPACSGWPADQHADHALGELRRLEELLDMGFDGAGLMMEAAELPQSIRRQRRTGVHETGAEAGTTDPSATAF